MIVILSALWITFFILYLLTRNYRKKRFESCDSKEHPMRSLYPTSYFIYKKLHIDRMQQRNQRTMSAYRMLQFAGNIKEQFEIYILSKISVVLLFIFCTLSLACLMQVSELLGQQEQGVLIVEHTAEHQIKKLKIKTESGTEDELSIEIERIKEPQQSEQETQLEAQKRNEYSKAYEYIDQQILNKNPGISQIGSELSLIQTIPETGASVCWRTEPENIIDVDGTVHNEMLQEPTQVYLQGHISSADNETLGDYQITVCVLPQDQYEYVIWKQDLTKEIQVNINQTSEDSIVRLPKEFRGKRIEWVKKTSYEPFYFLLLGLLASIMIFFEMDEQLHTKVKKRKKQMLYDYPNIINKLTLLIGAGMTVSGAWERIVKDYAKLTGKNSLYGSNSSKKKRKAEVHYAYEEMKITNHELDLGVSEAIAFEAFGRRSGVVEYMKLSSVLIQNMRKGTQGLTQILALMAQEAFEGRKQRARQLGEEAGTKLLLPMMIMLLLVLIIIMVPAFWSMKL